MKTLVSLPKETEMPPIIREIMVNAPKNRKLASMIACLSPLAALCSRVRLHYCYDTRPSALLLQVLIEGAQSSGKSFAADIESLIMDETLKARDKAMRRQEQDYREKKKRRKANEKLEEEPGPKESLFDLLADTFTREQLNILIEQKGKSTPATVFLSKWKKFRVIEVIDKNTFRKIH